MTFPVIDLATPTRVAFEWGWLLVTNATFVVFVLLAVVFVIGITVREPGVRRRLAQARAERDAAAASAPTTAERHEDGR